MIVYYVCPSCASMNPISYFSHVLRREKTWWLDDLLIFFANIIWEKVVEGESVGRKSTFWRLFLLSDGVVNPIFIIEYLTLFE